MWARDPTPILGQGPAPLIHRTPSVASPVLLATSPHLPPLPVALQAPPRQEETGRGAHTGVSMVTGTGYRDRLQALSFLGLSAPPATASPAAPQPTTTSAPSLPPCSPLPPTPPGFRGSREELVTVSAPCSQRVPGAPCTGKLAGRATLKPATSSGGPSTHLSPLTGNTCHQHKGEQTTGGRWTVGKVGFLEEGTFQERVGVGAG